MLARGPGGSKKRSFAAKVKSQRKAAGVGKKEIRRVAIFGGAFDPPTWNHLLGSAEVVHSGEADEVWLVPCGPRPDKPRLSSVLHRYIMAQISVNSSFSASLPVRVCDVEVTEPEALATYDLLRSLRAKHSDTDFSFLIGTDWLQSKEGTDLRQWTSKDPETNKEIVTGHRLVSEFEFVVIPRPGYDVKDLAAFGPRMKYLQMPDGIRFMEGNLSSTEVRKRRNAGSPARIEGLVTPACLAYITRHGLYESASMGETPSLPFSMPAQPKKATRDVAVFGGAFDPPTHSHMMSLAELVHAGIADEALIVPCGPRPDKPHLRPPLVRYSMCQLAVNTSFSANMPVRASDLEVFEPKALATYDALRRLREMDPSANFLFVIGSDWLQPGTDLRNWTSEDPKTGKDIVTGHKLVEEFDFIVVKRPGFEVEELKSFGPRMRWMDMPHGMNPVSSNLSSTEVRKRAAISYDSRQGKLALLDGLVPVGVFNYMRREGTYKPK